MGDGISLGRNRSSREERLCSRSTSSGYGNGSRTPNGVRIVVIPGARVATDRYWVVTVSRIVAMVRGGVKRFAPLDRRRCVPDATFTGGKGLSGRGEGTCGVRGGVTVLHPLDCG